MASTRDVERIGSRLSLIPTYHDPSGTSAEIATAGVDMRDFCNVGFLVSRGSGAGSYTLVEIVASSASNMANPVVIKTSGTVAADAEGDYVWIETAAEDIQAEGTDLRYVACRITASAATATSTVTSVRVPLHMTSGLTATTIA